MVSYWTILEAMALAQLVLAGVLLYMVSTLYKRPVGLKLIFLALIFTLQSIAALLIYNSWQAEGYGKEISLPLTLIQSASLLGTLILLDITRT